MIFKQPKSFYLIFVLELWERFSFYGLQAIITIFLVKKMWLSESDAITLFSSFTAIVYGLVSVGGWLGDKILGIKRTMLLGIITLTIGYTLITLSFSNTRIMYLGLATVAIGNCLFKANPASLLSRCYKNDPKIDTAFTMYYMAVNIGSIFSMLLTPWLMHKFGWEIAFSTSIIGLLITLTNFLYFKKVIKDYGSKTDFMPLNKIKLIIVIIGIIIAILCSTFLLYNQNIANKILEIIIFFVIIYFLKETLKLKGDVQKKMIVTFILMLEAILFFVLYNQMPTSLNFFAIRNVKSNFLGFNIKPEQYQALNPFWIIICSPILAKIYDYIGDKLSIVYKFAIGMSLCCISFLILPLGIKLNSNIEGLISPIWLILSYLLQSLGELMISGLGLSMVAQLVPRKLTGFIMGTWFLTTSIAAIISGYVANIMTFPQGNSISKISSLAVYYSAFLKIGLFTGFITLIIIIISPKLNSVIKPKINNK